ncbi:MAG: hypothetical protein AMXMBFR19_09190 [Chthonomonadaceae bacterium]
MTIPACKQCGDEKSMEDVYLRDFLGFRMEVVNVPELEFLREAAKASALKEDKIRPGRAILATWQSIYQVMPGGYDLKLVAGQVEIDGDRVRKAFEWITRGIYFNHQKSILEVRDFAMEGFTGDGNRKERERLWPDFDEKTACAVGNSVRYKFSFTDTNPPSGTCLIDIYDRLFFRMRYNVAVLIEAAEAKGLVIPEELRERASR